MNIARDLASTHRFAHYLTLHGVPIDFHHLHVFILQSKCLMSQNQIFRVVVLLFLVYKGHI